MKTVEQYSSGEDSSSNSDSDIKTTETGNQPSSRESESESESEDEQEKARKELANVPFNKLIKIQQRMMENKRSRPQQTIGMRGHVSDNDDSDGSSSSSDSAPEAVSTKKNFQRDSKKQPSMMTSKRPVSRFRQVVDLPAGKTQTRDPRFDGLSGNFNEDLFEKSYGFLDKQRLDEIEEMKEQIRKLKTKDPEQARRIQTAVNSMQSQIAAKNKQKHAQELKRKHRNMELEAVKQGKMPYFLKKRDLKDIEVAEKFAQLKDTSKLDTFLEKRRKRNAAKDHRHMPQRQRRSDH